MGGIIGTRIWTKRREQGNIAARLAPWASQPAKAEPRSLLKRPEWSSLNWQFIKTIPGIDSLKKLLNETGFENSLNTFVSLEIGLLVFPILLALTFELNFAGAVFAGLVLAIIPIAVLKRKADALQAKFCEQLPDAIDLMIAVLRSGHSVAQAVKAVAQEIPNPCGSEFEAILHRMNLGQPLSESLILSAQRFHSYELDLIRRAVAIQIEVGGSLAELLDKTNATLRERLKLARQLKVVTAQSRLSALIVGLLPIVLAFGLNIMSPGYLQYLIADQLGRGLLCGSILLELIGIYVMRRMSTMKV